MNESIALSGRLDFVSLPQVLQFLASNASSGTLVIRSPHASEPGLICFHDGSIFNAFCGKTTGIQAAYDLFGWTEGEFAFDLARVEKQRVISESMMEIVMEGVRMLDEGQTRKLGPSRTAASRTGMPALEDGVPFVPSPDVDYSYVVAEEVFSKGQNIVEEGNYGNWICVMLDGYANVVKQTPQGPFTLCCIGPGAIIGDIAIVLKKENVRRATVIALGEVTLGVLDLERIHRELAVMSRSLQGLLLSLNRRLSEVSHNWARIHASFKTADMNSLNGKQVFTPGAKGDELYTITDGYASLVCKNPSGFVRIADLEPGDFVGRAPFLDLGHEPSQAHILTSEDFAARRLPLDDLVEEYGKSSPMMKCIASYISNCVAATTLGIRNFSPKESVPASQNKKRA